MLMNLNNNQNGTITLKCSSGFHTLEGTNSTLIELETHSTKGNRSLYLKPNQLLRANEVINLREEPIPPPLLNLFALTLRDKCSPHLSTGKLFFATETIIKKNTTNQNVELWKAVWTPTSALWKRGQKNCKSLRNGELSVSCVSEECWKLHPWSLNSITAQLWAEQCTSRRHVKVRGEKPTRPQSYTAVQKVPKESWEQEK